MGEGILRSIIETLSDTVSFNNLPSRMYVTYMGYVLFARLLSKNIQLPPLLKRLRVKSVVGEFSESPVISDPLFTGLS